MLRPFMQLRQAWMPATQPRAGDQGRLPSVLDAPPCPQHSWEGEGTQVALGLDSRGSNSSERAGLGHLRHFTVPLRLLAKCCPVLTLRHAGAPAGPGPCKALPAEGEARQMGRAALGPSIPQEGVQGTPTCPVGCLTGWAQA